MSLAGSTDIEKFGNLTTKTHKEQCVWFLNAFWNKVSDDAEKIWSYTHKFAELDPNRSQGNSVDELGAHRFLEFFNETMTVKQMRDVLREVGAIGNDERPKTVSIIHYLVFRYKSDWRYLVNAAQGDNQEEIAEAQRRLEAVQAAFKEAARTAELAATALAESHARESEAKAAQAELQAALAELKAQEDAYNQKKADLERRSEEGGVVSRNKAKAELAQLLAEDPLPLRRAKISQEAAVRKAEKTALAAAEARAASEAAAAAAEAALDEAKARVDDAEAFLNEVKSRPGQAQGAIWWIERELHEARAYMPSSKGGYTKKKV